MLGLPPLDSFIQGEARCSAFRLRNHIKENQVRISGSHSEIINLLYDWDSTLQAPNDIGNSRYSFDRSFETVIPDREEWISGNILNSLTGNVWFTDAAVRPEGCGYGILDQNSNTKYFGYMGVGLSSRQAELAALLICCLEIARSDDSTTPIRICTDSESAIRALCTSKTKSKIIAECIDVLNGLANNRAVTVIWVPAHMGIGGNSEADRLARMGSMSPSYGPKPITTLYNELPRKLCNSWLDEAGASAWRRYNADSHSKLFLPAQFGALSKKLLTLTKLQLRIVTCMITGHVGLNEYKARIKVRDDPDCDRCNQGAETALHFLCKCPAWASIRREIYGAVVISPQDVQNSDLKLICAFTKRTQRLDGMFGQNKGIANTRFRNQGGTVHNTASIPNRNAH